MKRHRKARITIFLFTFVMLLLEMTGTAFAKENSTTSSLQKYDYVSLGDSLAAGQTPYGVSTGYGYTDIIADKLAGEGVLGTYRKYGVAGYKTSDVLAQLQNRPVIYSIQNAEIVTIDIGANDLLSSAQAYFCGQKVDLETQISNSIKNIAAIIITIKTINPTAKIYVMGYYNALPNLDQTNENLFLDLLNSFNSSVKTVVNSIGSNVYYVDTYDSVDKHLQQYLPGDIHPTIQGYRAIAQDFWNEIKLNFRNN